MAEKSTIARPYAEAVFETAQSSNQLSEWSTLLQSVALITADENMQALIGNTSVNKEQLAQLIIEIADTGKKNAISDQGNNFIKLLTDNRRLNVVTEIVEQYETLKAEAEKTVEAEIVSAQKISAAQEKLIAQKLKARLGRDVSLRCTVNESLLGGAIIKAGDMVIDGSASSQLNKLSVELVG